MNRAIEQLQRRFQDFADPERNPELWDRVSVLEVSGKLYVDFWGSPFDEPFSALCECLVRPDVASALVALSLRSPKDVGANGTRDWNLTVLADSGVVFINLVSLAVEQAGPGDHNTPIVSANHYYEEGGVLGRLLTQSPRLEELTVPSAPDRSFFDRPPHPLRYLNVDSGYDTQGVIGNLAASECFPNLQTLEFGEFNATYLDSFPAGCTPFASYRQLFTSRAFSNVRSFVWRNPAATEAEIEELRSLRPKENLQMQIVRFSSRYL